MTKEQLLQQFNAALDRLTRKLLSETQSLQDSYNAEAQRIMDALFKKIEPLAEEKTSDSSQAPQT